MKLFPLFLVATIPLTGCVMNDSRVRTIRLSATNVEAFTGTYSNQASYRSESSFLGLYNTERLDQHLDPNAVQGNASAVVISVAGDTVIADVFSSNRVVKAHRFLMGKDCSFQEGYLVFRSDTKAAGGGDSPTLGAVVRQKMRWTLDSKQNLVVVTRTAGAGTIGIFPVGMATKWMAVFPRIEPLPEQNETR